MQVFAFRHSPLEGIGTIADALARRRIDCRLIDSPTNSTPPHELENAAGLILMGGPMSVNDDFDWLRDEEDAIRHAVDRGKPVLGICLGAQLIAKALGARVYRNPVREIGWAPVYWTGPARSDLLFRDFAAPEMLFHWHGETFDLPKDAEHLAYSDACVHQAFRVGSNVYGMQFHAEVTPAVIEDWCRSDEACGSAREMVAPIDPYANAPRLVEMANTIFDRWCGLLS